MTLGLAAQDLTADIIQWGTANEAIRAMLLTSTQAVPGAPRDILSDYDVILIVQALEPFVDGRSWLANFGEVLVVYWDPVTPDPEFGINTCANVTQYASGLKIDFTLWPVALFEKIVAAPELTAELDAGYRVLLDKDGLTNSMRQPTHKAYVPKRPSLLEYQTHINDFLSDAPYVAKCLWRDELFPAKWALDFDMKNIYLQKMLQWRIEVDFDWSSSVGSLGKGLKKRLPPDLWDEVEKSFAGSGIEENWEALARTLAVFRRAAIEVGNHLGYDYPEKLHERVAAYVAQIKGLEQP